MDIHSHNYLTLINFLTHADFEMKLGVGNR